MDMTALPLESTPAQLSDEDVVRRVVAGETELFEILMRRYNQRVYRAVRAIVRDDADAEDVLQQAYVNAYQHLPRFEERARFSTWLTRIAINEALARVRRSKQWLAEELAEESMSELQSQEHDPERTPRRVGVDLKTVRGSPKLPRTGCCLSKGLTGQ